MSSLYEVLGVDDKATREAIRLAYKALLLSVHPDKHGDGSAAFLCVQHAWNVLKDGDARAAYDRELARRRLHKIHVVAVVEAASMAFDEEDSSLSHACRCGGSYKLTRADAEAGVSVVQCSNCSYYVEVFIS